MGLAGPKTKQRISSDPRNKKWAQDNGRVGMKMLSKMGWKEGQGLGSGLQGKSSNLSVLHKQDTLGIGAANTSEDNWLTNSLDDLFKDLNGERVEERREAKKRVGRLYHRQKFVKSKQLSNFQQGDINEILGVKKQVVSAEQVKDNVQKPKDQVTLPVEEHVQVTASSNMHDYFKEKMARLNTKKQI